MLGSLINSVLERQKNKSEKENVVAFLRLNWMSENLLLKICAEKIIFANLLLKV
jgi:hypothetical protein